jgi:hypothetical protein
MLFFDQNEYFTNDVLKVFIKANVRDGERLWFRIKTSRFGLRARKFNGKRAKISLGRS